MDTKKSMWVLVGYFIIAAWLLGFVIETQAETMKCRVARQVTKEQTIPVSHEEGREFGLQINEGLAFFENGDVANFKSEAIFERTNVPGRGSQAISYIYFTFEDGSSIIIRLEYRQTVDASGKISTKTVGEIVKGTRRYEGIKGTFSSTGKRLPPIKGEADKYIADATLTYTLPPK